MSLFPAPPTYADPVITDEHTQKAQFNPIWLKWFLDVTNFITLNGGGTGGTINHNTLAGLQGGGGLEYYHLTAAQNALLSASVNPRYILSGPVSGAPAAPSYKVLSAAVAKSADENRSNTTTLANDSELLFSIGANETWMGRMFVALGDAIKTTGAKVSVVGPTGATGTFHASVVTDAASGQEVDVIHAISLGSPADFTAAALSNSNHGYIEIVFRIVNGVNTGSIALQWAQSTSSATVLSVHAASQIKADRLA